MVWIGCVCDCQAGQGICIHRTSQDEASISVTLSTISIANDELNSCVGCATDESCCCCNRFKADKQETRATGAARRSAKSTLLFGTVFGERDVVEFVSGAE